ncbi:MAG: mechanosensitive ion channel [Bacilli bacterium]|nr:mechanosensitive ion channel [Bacilli bacterium]
MDIVAVWDKLMLGVPSVVEALILLVIAFICATIVRELVFKTMQLVRLDKGLEKAKIEDEKKTSIKEFIGKLFYLIVFILFIPGIFEKLGLTGVAEPIVKMMNKLLEYMPNIVAASVILIIGLCIAKIVKELLIPIFRNLKVDSYLTKVGFEDTDKVSLSEVFAKAIYVLILVPVVIASLDALKIEAISKPSTEMLNDILVFMPRAVIAIVILFVGKFIASLASDLLEKVLVSIGTDKITESIIKTNEKESEKDFSLSKIIAGIVKYVIIIFFVVEGLNILKLQILTNIGSKVISYMPYAISSLIIIGIAFLLGSFAEKNINEKFTDSKISALIVKIVIFTVGVFIALYQLGIAKGLVNSAFIIILSAFAIAFAVSFGIGGRDFAKNMLGKLERKIDKRK